MKLAETKLPKHEHEQLLCHLLGLSRVDVCLRNEPLDKAQETEFNHMLNKRLRNTPLQYIIGKTGFFGLELLTPEGVFIPRPETEVLVEAVIANALCHPRMNLAGIQACPSILDLCTGAGNVALSLAKNIPNARITATDISANAIKTAKDNAARNGVSQNLEFVEGDLFKALAPERKFDIIVCNPPYIKREDLAGLPQDVQQEPVQALDGGEDGLDFYRRIFSQAPEFLNPGGFVAVEIGEGQAEDVKRIATAGNFTDFEIIKDLNRINRIVIAWIKS